MSKAPLLSAIPRTMPVALLALGWAVALLPAQESRAGSPPARLEVLAHEGLRIVRVSGSPRARGEAVGRHFAKEILQLIEKELVARYGNAEQALVAARARLPQRIAFPDGVRAEIDGLHAGLVASGVDLTLHEFDRPLDLRDLELVNALDVFATLGCSGFTVAGDQVQGGGVLTTRNFDWPFTGPHLVAGAVLLVVIPERGGPEPGHAHAFVTWPGYFGAVTAVNDAGLAVFLHVGSGKIDTAPRPASWPSACATRVLLERATAGTARAQALEVLANTSPPASYMTRVVLPAPAGETAELVFETDTKIVVERTQTGYCVTTNHFLARADGRPASGDSKQRYGKLCASLTALLGADDHRVSIGEAWQALAGVQRSGTALVTLHSLVFRDAPWCFELALGSLQRGQVRGAPVTGARVSVPRELLFGR